jgi:hypothetical protein
MTNFGGISTSRGLFYGNDEAGQRRWEKDMQQRCEAIADQVRRHVDDVGYVSVEWESSPVCSHCGSRWTEISDRYNGGCCDKDEEANPDQETASV